MHRREGRLTRARGGLLCASACLSLGALSHVAAGGSLPGPGTLGLLFAVVTVLGAALFGNRRLRFDVLTLILGGTQFVLHLAFHHLAMRNPVGHPPSPAGAGHAATGGHAGTGAAEILAHGAHLTTSASHVRDAGHVREVGHAMGAGHVLGAGHAMGAEHAISAEHAMGAAMTSAHALATLGTALSVIHGERVLRRLAALALPRFLPTTAPTAPPLLPELSPPPAATGRPGFGALLARSRPRRGPPRVMSA
ncbi:hypothetical protein [Streptomyces sp. NPDC058657]|uniref:hypothetical protein n=1 Tax=unclassified Streptomyces TaxID=2593676 RepID=UPI003655CDF5